MRELSLNVLDIVQNSVKAGATQIEIDLAEEPTRHTLVIAIRDNGSGMTEEQVKHVMDPFFTTRTTRKVGMGVPLFKMAAEMTGGSLDIQSEPGEGTAVTARFHTDHVDFVPLGDIAATVEMLVTQNTGIDFLYRQTCGGAAFTFDTKEIKKILGGVPLNTPEVIQWIREYLKENINSLYGGVQNENS